MTTISDQMISSVIRRIDVKEFSEEAHGPGRAINYNSKTKSASIRTDNLIERLKPSRNLTTYFLKQVSKPQVVEAVPFTWKEGTSNVSLDFFATFQLRVDTTSIDESLSIVCALHHPHGVGCSLYEIIDGCIDRVLSDEYRRCQERGVDLLSIFYKSGVLVHDSESLDRKISAELQKTIGVRNANIGLRLAHLPPQYLEIQCETFLDIRDIEEQKYKVKTKADVELSNYQLFKQQGFDKNTSTEDTIRESIQSDIHRAVRKHVFDFGYFDLIESFYTTTVTNNEDAISKKIENDIKLMVSNKGYEIKLFHTLCDIPPLVLIDQGMRVTLNPEMHQFKTKDSSLPVGLNLTLGLHLKSFKKIKSIIKPEHDALKMEFEITDQIYHACKDVLANTTIYEFDLAFDESIRYKLVENLDKNLREKFGFEFEIVTMQPILSENKERLDALINETRKFQLSISSQANSGARDNVEYQGAFIVTGMDEQGYHRFVSKDFGFCKTSNKRNDSAYQKLLAKIRSDGASMSIGSSSFEQAWKQHCVEFELESLAKGIEVNAEEYFSKEAEVAAKTRNYKASEQLRSITEKIGLKFAFEEFGLKITITQFKRLDTATEIENLSVRDHKRELRGLYRENDKASLLSQLDADADYRKQASELKTVALKQAFAEDDLERSELEEEVVSNPNVDRDVLFDEFDQEISTGELLVQNESVSLLENYQSSLSPKKLEKKEGITEKEDVIDK